MNKIKCVIWDLDNTLWNGILSENDNLILNYEVIDVIKYFDSQGILQSISSKNFEKDALEKLEKYNIIDYFLLPQINWNPKYYSIQLIAKKLNILLSNIAFIDDSERERKEVMHYLSDVRCYNPSDISKWKISSEFRSNSQTIENSKRRYLYNDQFKRELAQEKFVGSNLDFLNSLNLKMTINIMKNDDLNRIYELVQRTHQLNTTGICYSYEQIINFMDNKKYKILVINLQDKFGDFGSIGMILLEEAEYIIIKLFLLSCRVMSFGLGSELLEQLKKYSLVKHKILLGEYIDTGKNKMMYTTYLFSGFKIKNEKENLIMFEWVEDTINFNNSGYLEVIDNAGISANDK